MTSRIAFALLLATAALPLCASAEVAAPEVKLAGFQLKNRSTYTGTEKTRPPFWPIGWVKRPPQGTEAPPEVVEKFVLDPDQFNLTSTLLLRPSFAVINGISYAEGEYIRVPRGKDKAAGDTKTKTLPTTARVRLAKVTDGAATLEVNGQLTELTLRRPQLSGHTADESGTDLLKPISERGQ